MAHPARSEPGVARVGRGHGRTARVAPGDRPLPAQRGDGACPRGRARRPPRAVERLLGAAGLAAEDRTSPAPGPDLLGEVGRLLDAHDPYPALALDAQWDVVAHNAAAGALLTLLDADALVGRNALRLALHPGGLVRYGDPDAPWVAALRARAADQAAQVPHGHLASVLASLPAGPADVPSDVTVPLHLRLPAGEVTLLAAGSRLAAPDDAAAAGLTIDTLLPADAASRALLRRLATTHA